MKIKSYEVEGDLLSYPVGNDIKCAIGYANKTALLFKSIKAYKDKEVNIWCRGSSGAILGALFSSEIPNHTRILHIKKEGETAHSTYPHPLDNGINIIVDDFIDTGNTIRIIYGEAKFYFHGKIKIHALIVENQGRLKENRAGLKLKQKLGFTPCYLITNSVL